MTKRILILGGYGNLGVPIAKYLVRERRDIEILLAGRNAKKAKEAAKRIVVETGFQHIQGKKVDASDLNALEKVLEPLDLVIVASSTMKHVETVAEAALKTHTDYLDAQLSSPYKLEILRKLEKKITESNRIFITDCGFHPGLLAAIIRWADLKVGPLVAAKVFGALKLDWGNLDASRETMEEMVDEFKTYDMSILRDGKWIKPGYNYSLKFDFGAPYYKQYCVPMLIEELRMLPSQMPELKEAGFFVTGFNKFLDYFLIPVIMVSLAVNLKRLATWLFKTGLKFCRPPFGVRVIADCIGKKGKMRVTFTDSDGYLLTAIPIVACVNQYLDAIISKPGLHFQAWAVEPERFFMDLKKMGLSFEIE